MSVVGSERVQFIVTVLLVYQTVSAEGLRMDMAAGDQPKALSAETVRLTVGHGQQGQERESFEEHDEVGATRRVR